MKYFAIFWAIACVSLAETAKQYLDKRLGHKVNSNDGKFEFTFNWTAKHAYFFALKFVHVANKNKSAKANLNVTLPNQNSSFNYSGITYRTGKEWCGVYALNKSSKCKSDHTGTDICLKTPEFVSRWPPTLKINNSGFNVRFYYAFFRCKSNPESRSTPQLEVATTMSTTETTKLRNSTSNVSGTTPLNKENTGSFSSPFTESKIPPASASSKVTIYLTAAIVLAVLLALTYLGILLKIATRRFRRKNKEEKPDTVVRFDTANGQVIMENPYAMADNIEPPQENNENDETERIIVNNELYNMDG